MKIRGNTVGTPIKPKEVLVKSENLTPEEQAQARANIGAMQNGVADTNLDMQRHGIDNASHIILSKKLEVEGADVYTAIEMSCGSTGDGSAFVALSDINGDPVRITGVADGTTDSDAATCGQLWDAIGETEQKANRVTTIDETADDEHYPTAKAVYDALSNINPGANGGTDSSNSLKLENDANTSIFFRENGNRLMAVTRSGGLTLDSVAYENKTYRDIFVASNFIPWGDFESGIDGVVVNRGNPEVTTEQSQLGSHSLKCFGTSNQQLRTDDLSETQIVSNLYIVCDVKVDRYVSGDVGVIVNTGAGYVKAARTAVTDGFERVSNIILGNVSHFVYVGSALSANLDGYIDNAYCIDLSIFDVKPSKAQMDALYDNYVKILKGESMVNEALYILAGANTGAEEDTTSGRVYTDSECIQAFMDVVNQRLSDLGMTNTELIAPSGASGGHWTTSRDMTKLMVSAVSYNELMKIWGKNSLTFMTKDSTPREITVETTVTSASFEDSYFLFGGKTGSGMGVENLCVIGELDGKMLAGVVLDCTSHDNRFVAMKELFDVAKQIIENPDIDKTTLDVPNANSCCCCLVPPYNTSCYDGYSFNYLFEKNADTAILPQSIGKIATAVAVLDHIYDLDSFIEFKESDIAVGGSGAVFEAGDVVTYRDALYAMMLPSSNQAATCLARTVGQKLLMRNIVRI